MTDIIKNFDQKASGKTMSYLGANKPFEAENVRIFREDITNGLGTANPSIIAFGNDAHSVLTRNVNNEHKILKISHYSHYISKEKYREEVKCILQFGEH